MYCLHTAPFLTRNRHPQCPCVCTSPVTIVDFVALPQAGQTYCLAKLFFLLLMGVFFEAPGEDLLIYGCANTSLNQFPFAFAKTSIQTHFHLQSCYPPDKDATDLFYLVYGCANASFNKFPFARAKTPIQTHVHLHSCCPQTKKQHCSICSPCGQKLEIRRCVSCMVHYS